MYTLPYLVYVCTYVTPLIDSEIAANALLNLPQTVSIAGSASLNSELPAI